MSCTACTRGNSPDWPVPLTQEQQKRIMGIRTSIRSSSPWIGLAQSPQEHIVAHMIHNTYHYAFPCHQGQQLSLGQANVTGFIAGNLWEAAAGQYSGKLARSQSHTQPASPISRGRQHSVSQNHRVSKYSLS